MRKLYIVLSLLTFLLLLSGCTSLNDAIIAGVQEAGVTINASASATTGAVIRNERGEEIVLVTPGRHEVRIP